MADKKSWADLTPKEKRVVYAGGTVEAVITVVALIDLSRRPADQVRGSKWAWLLSFVVQPFGRLSYFAIGRRVGSAS